MKSKIEKYLEQFPKNAKCWSQATDEVRDIARESREHLEYHDNIIVEPLDFKSFKTPAEWNTKGNAYILANFGRMDNTSKRMFYNRFLEWFEK